jgi:quercetin dioxygenase-like cupin family protein
MAITLTPDQIDPKKHEIVSRRTGAHRGEQHLVDDPDTGMLVKYQTYPAGDAAPWHTHHCAHGFYVLKGTLHTNLGDFGPGSFVWFPEGERMFHGATEDGPVEALFITNKTFDIVYE